MGQIIQIAVKNKIATAEKKTIICGNSDYSVQFSFDEEWGAYPIKTARFYWGSHYKDVIFEGDTCPVPIIQNATLCEVGAYAGELHTTTPAVILCKKSILCKDGTPKTEEPDVYSQLMEELNQEIGKAQEAATEAETARDEAEQARDEAIKAIEDISGALGGGCAAAIKNNASGEIVALTDSANAPLDGLTVYGKTTQDAEPTPEAPQELKSVGADGDIKVNITRKNLCTEFVRPTFGTAFNGIVWEKRNDGAIVANGTATAQSYCATKNFYLPKGKYVISGAPSGGGYFIYAVFKDFNENTLFTKIAINNTPLIIDLDTDCYCNFNLIVDPNKTISNLVFKPQIEAGTVATEYEPYQKPQVMTILTPAALNGIPVTKNGNYTDESGQQWVTDEIDFERGVRIQRVKEIMLTGNEGEWSIYNISTEGYNSFRNSLFDGVNISNLQNLCTHYKAYGDMTGFYFGQLQGCYVGNTNENVCKLIIGDVFSTVEDFKAYLAGQYSNGTPVKVKYVLAEPIETPLTEAEMVAYQEYYTNYPNTTIYSDDGAFLNIKYKADTKAYIDNKFNSLQQAIISLGGNI